MIDQNDAEVIRERDPQGMLEHIAGLPDQCQAAWQTAQQVDLPESFKQIERVIIAGMGGSAIGGSLLAALAAPHSRIPIHVVRDYTLPAIAQGASTLVIGSSYSGDTEETIAMVTQARERGCQLLGIASGGEIAAISDSAGAPILHIPYKSPPRAVIGYSFVSLLEVASRLGWIDDQSNNLQEAISVMRKWNSELAPESPIVKNLAKREAGQMMGRFVIIFGAGYFVDVARRWKTQINENGKQYAAFEALPEADHNVLLGSTYPEDMLMRLKLIFLSGASDHPRNVVRTEITREMMMMQGCDADILSARGDSALAQMLSLVQLGDWISAYLGILNGADPSDTEILLELKKRMKEIGG